MICPQCYKRVNAKDAHCGLHSECFCDWFDLEQVAHFSDVARKQASSSATGDRWAHMNSSFFQGKFKKYSAKLLKKSYILKTQERDYPELPATEFLCNEIAQILKLDIPFNAYILFENQIPTFICENFMQYHQNANLVHIYHFLSNPDDFNCETLYQIIKEKTKRLSDLTRFIHMILYDALVGNDDRHGRNIALIERPNGYRLSPIYDNPCYLGIEEEELLRAQHEPRGKIATKMTDEPTMKDYVKEWARLDCLQAVIDFKNIINLSKIGSLVDSAFISENRKAAIKRLINRRYQELIDECAA